MNLIKTCTTLLLTIGFYTSYTQEIVFPHIKKDQIRDVYFDTTIVDEYRSLEDITSPNTMSWLESQHKICEKTLSKYERKLSTEAYLNDYSNVNYNKPLKRGKYYYRYMYESKFNTPNLYVQKDIDSNPFKIFDPRDISKTDVISISNFKPSKDSKHIAVMYSRNGSDWKEIRVVTSIGKLQNDHILDVKFSPLAWKDDGFFYFRYPRRGQFQRDSIPVIYYHKLGTNQSEDLFIEKGNSVSSNNISFQVTSDEKYMIVTKTNTYGRQSLYYADLDIKPWLLKPLLLNFKEGISIIDSHKGYLIAATDKIHANGSLVKINPANPTQWEKLTTPYKDAMLVDAKVFANQIICKVISGPKNYIFVYNHSGELVKSITLEDGYTIDGFMGEKDDKQLLFYSTTYFLPPVVYKIDLISYQINLFDITNISYQFEDYEIKVTSYMTPDSVNIPITLVHKKKLKLNGNNPTLLDSYGGFGSIHKPSFDPALVYFLSRGGVYAYAHVRGEGTLGAAWEFGGKRLQKRNSINDFIAAAEFLIRQKYTSSEHLAITGGSNGGLLVAAAMIQRPELFKVVVPIVGVFDMLRFEKFTVGAFHINEYGTVTNKRDFENLLSYSPLHQVKEDVNYPATLVMTSDNDNRVPPFHSYKFVAKLQNRPNQKNPILLRLEKNAGHYGAATRDTQTEQDADMYSFILYHIK